MFGKSESNLTSDLWYIRCEMTPISQQECRGNLEFAESIFRIHADYEQVIFCLGIFNQESYMKLFCTTNVLGDNKNISFFGHFI